MKTPMKTTVHQAFELCGQSIWYDNISRGLLQSGELVQLREQGVRGVTSNPSIFQKAISTDPGYAAQLGELARAGKSALQIYEALVLDDIRAACDVFRQIYDASNARDGYVSIEVLPSLATETDETLQEAVRLAKAVARPNLMVKIPGTPEGFPAIEEAIAAGVSINVTLLFSVEQYQRTAEAYVRGIERRVAQGLPVDKVASVASFFVSRVDSACDPRLEAEGAREALGRTGIANCKMAYRAYQELIAGERWKALARAGAQTQRLLWGSTSTKNPAYPDTLYLDTLIGQDTVNTVPPAALTAFLDHGKVAPELEQGFEEAEAHMKLLVGLGIDLDSVCRKLLEEGVAAFKAAMDSLMKGIEARRAEAALG